MSLINETLKNLDKQNSKRKGQNILSGLNAPNQTSKQRHLPVLLFVILLLVILIVAIYYCWPTRIPHVTAVAKQNNQTLKSQPKGTMQITAVPLDQKQKAQHLYRQALQAIANNQTEEAIKTLQVLLYAQPDNVQARETLAVLLFRTGQKNRASEIVAAGTARNPNNIELIELQAHILATQNKNAEAISVLQQRPLSIHTYPDYYAYMAALYQRQGQYMSAARLYNKLVKIMPGKAVWWVGLGVALESMDKNAAALESYKRALNVGVNLDANTRAFVEEKIAKLG